MAIPDLRSSIQQALAKFAVDSLPIAARELLATLGYSSERMIDVSPNTAAGFTTQFGPLNDDQALTSDWQTVDFLFQLTGEEIGSHLAFSTGQVDNTIIESYVFLAIHLTGEH